MANIVFTGGGTAGHYAPNYALIPLVKPYFDNVYYIGGSFGGEKDEARRNGIPYYGITCVKLIRGFTLKNLGIPFKLLKGISEAKAVLKKLRPSVVFSKGGYVSLPVVIASYKLNIPVISHESDISVGLANKIASKYSDVVLTSFKNTSGAPKNAVYVGTPIRESLFIKRDKYAVKKKYGVKTGKKILLIIGGSQGSSAINQAVRNALDELVKTYEIIHICGKGKKSGIVKDGYREIEYAEDIGEVYSIADASISRAGANTLFELISLKIPTLAVPLPKGNSRGDQVENAEYFKNNGLIEALSEENLTTETLIKSLEKLEKDREKIKRKCAETNFKGSAQRIAEYIKKYK